MSNKNIHKTSISFIRRQYMASPDYEAFYFNDIGIDDIERHNHCHYEIYFFLEGNVNYTVGDKNYELKPGDFLLIPPDTIHGPDIVDNGVTYCRFVLWIGKHFYDKMSELCKDFTFGMDYISKNKTYKFHLEYIQYNDLLGNFLDLWHEYNENRIFKDTTITNYIITIMLKINRIIYENCNKEHKIPQKELYALIFEYINSNITSDLTLENIAAHFFVSKYYISHIFKDNLGISLHQYIIKKRLYGCRSAIAAGEPITTVAEKFGFADYTSFFRAFKKEYGISPKDYREKLKLQQQSPH